jgi:predicted ArsR family transcriptional regulator
MNYNYSDRALIETVAAIGPATIGEIADYLGAVSQTPLDFHLLELVDRGPLVAKPVNEEPLIWLPGGSKVRTKQWETEL